jgi:cysteine desulfurase / selenocysteine lyase
MLAGMNVAEILSNEELRRHEFPVCRDKVFLAHAGVCPLPRRVAEAVRDYATLCTQGDQETLLPALRMDESRELAARLLACQPAEIAFVGPTSLALSYVAAGLNWRKGDNVVIYHDDYPSNVYPWMALADRGVQVRLLGTRELGRIQHSDVIGLVDEQTRLVALASCHFVAGWRILFCLDAIQTVGAFPTSVEHVDFLAADAHKWMLGPCAAGLLYVRRALQDKLRPPIYGWHNVRCPNFIAQERLELRSDARRYEAGSTNLLGLVGLHAAMELLLEVGVADIAAEILRKRKWLVQALRERGCEVLHADAPEANAGGMVSFHKPGTDLAPLHDRLTSGGIITSLRADRSGRQYLRLSPHFYNTDAELARVVEKI